jgi:formamidopyrimidine-DNA glycosylase
MPEGPELRHSRDVLRETIKGKTITKMSTTESGRYKSKMPEGMQLVLQELPAKVTEIDVKGKFMWWTLQGKTQTWRMWTTYGMSGQWSLKPKQHTCFVIDFGDKQAFFVDPRHFGTIKFTCDEKEHEAKLASLGPDVLEDPPLSPELFAERILLKPHRTISEVLMDQRCISGVGNYLKAEALYRAGISPHRPVINMNANEIEKLWAEVILSCRESYADHGASVRTYKTVDDKSGKSQFSFRVYNRKVCEKGHATSREETLDNRTSWWCKECQH